MIEPKTKSEPPSTSSSFYRPKIEKANTDTNLNKQLKGILVERRLSHDELRERREWVEKKRSKTNLFRYKSRVTHEVQFSDKLFGLYCARFSSNGDIIAACFGSGCIQLRNGDTGVLRSSIRSGLESSMPATCCKFHPRRKEIIYVSSACGSIFQCKVDEVQFWKFAEELNNEINAIDINITGEQIASVGKDAGLRIYDAETTQLVNKYKRHKDDLICECTMKYHDMRIYAVKYHRDNPSVLVTGGWDDTVKIWDLRSDGACTRTIYGPHICGEAIDLHDTNILTGSYIFKDSLQLWDLSSGKLIETINPVNRQVTMAGEHIYSASYFDGDPCGKHVIVGGSATGVVEIINLKEKMVVGSYKANKAVMTIATQYTNIVYGGMDSVITLARFD